MRSRKLRILSLVCVILLIILLGLIIYVLNRDERPEAVSPHSEDSVQPGEASSSDSLNVPTSAPGASVAESENKSPAAYNEGKAGEDTENSVPEDEASDTEPDTPPEPVTLVFAGDINLDEDSKPAARYDREQKGISGCISPDLIKEMTSADIMMLNNEFAYSNRGIEEQDKSYTFRAKPERVKILKEMGVDIVSLANNHALDFGMDALLDTFTVLEDSDIAYVGAGRNLERAKAPLYYDIGDYRIAVLAASRVVFAMDWYAGDDSPGMIGTYDPSLILESIRKAEAESDFVVIYLHWGVERTNYPVDYQKKLARQYIEAGADVVVGCHPHVMQGLELYEEKPIAYSLGNYWFNASKRETGLLKITLNPDKTFSTQLIPAMAENTYTYMLEEEADREEYFDFIEEISFGIEIDSDGFVREK